MDMKPVERARSLVGTQFRPQGRTTDGLDCIGVICIAYAIPTAAVRRDYKLRGEHLEELRRSVEIFFRPVSRSALRPGDLMLFQVRADQLHLAVQTDRGFIHAHAGIGRVVETPGRPEWDMVGAFRRRRRKRSI